MQINKSVASEEGLCFLELVRYAWKIFEAETDDLTSETLQVYEYLLCNQSVVSHLHWYLKRP